MAVWNLECHLPAELKYLFIGLLRLEEMSTFTKALTVTRYFVLVPDQVDL